MTTLFLSTEMDRFGNIWVLGCKFGW